MRDYDDAPGECAAVENCKRAREDYRRGVPLTHCGFIGGKLVICCPNQATTTTTKKIAARVSSGKRISELSEIILNQNQML